MLEDLQSGDGVRATINFQGERVHLEDRRCMLSPPCSRQLFVGARGCGSGSGVEYATAKCLGWAMREVDGCHWQPELE